MVSSSYPRSSRSISTVCSPRVGGGVVSVLRAPSNRNGGASTVRVPSPGTSISEKPPRCAICACVSASSMRCTGDAGMPIVCSASNHSPLGRVANARCRERFVLGAVLRAELARRESLVGGERFTPGHHGEQLHQTRLEVHRRLHHDVDAVARREHHRGGRRVGALAVADEQPAEQRLQHADVDVRARAGTAPARRAPPARPVPQWHPRRDPRPGSASGPRTSPTSPGELERAPECLHRTVGRRLLRRRAVGTEARDGAVHEPRTVPCRKRRRGLGYSETRSDLVLRWWRGKDLNLRPSGYEPDELPDCSTPRRTDQASKQRSPPRPAEV